MFEKILQKIKLGSCKTKVSDDVNAFKESDKKQDTTTNTDTKQDTTTNTDTKQDTTTNTDTKQDTTTNTDTKKETQE